ncbi:MAG: nitrogen regulation protein NR(I) [Wenzhouxiangella sp.]|nr:nitrogen regulation protein NR(I) [Wenzhouxiangella sp.]MDR9452466.1 nitrogen regulation protein NR(I) [Wenzhouxiangella sp.]
MPNKRIWIIDDDPGIRYVLEEYLTSQGFEVAVFSQGQDLLDAFEQAQPETGPSVVMADIRLQDESGLDLMQMLRQEHPDLPVIVMTAYSDLKTAVGAFQGGAFEFLAKPFDLDEVKRLIDKALQDVPSTDEQTNTASIGLVGQSAALQELIRVIGRVSHTDIPVLITGETGSGKELVARALHQHSPRAQGPFVAINTAAIPAELLESELFGHERGAFPGATEKRIGRFEQAANGTLFLDEIGDMPLPLQTRLLRVLAEGEYYRLGGHDLIQAKARIICSTNQDLEGLVQSHAFRADLYHRLKVISLKVPPLRERRDDIPQLVQHFFELACEEFHVERKTPKADLLQALSRLDWPGNVRELKNLCQSLAVLAPAAAIGVDDLPGEYLTQLETFDGSLSNAHDWAHSLAQHVAASGRTTDLFDDYKASFERTLAQTVLSRCGGNQSKAARILGISRNTLARFLNQTTESTS